MNVTPDLDARFRAAALGEGLVDVRYDVFDSPVGELHVAQTERGLCRISYFGEAWEDQLARQAEGGPRGRHRDEPQPDPDRAAVPPHRRRERLAHRVCRRSRGEACAL